MPPSELVTALERADGACVLRVAGEVDLLTARDLEAAIAEALDTGDDLLLDIQEVSFMDSTGLRVLLEARLRAQSDGRTLRLALADGSAVARLLELAGVLSLFDRTGQAGPPA